ncbi:MAG: hypothetical protein ACI9RU_001139 [Litorivivens sp.]|jgi:hypothetical protein
MKKFFMILAAGTILAACGHESAPTKVEITEDGKSYSYYGKEITDEGAITVNELVQNMSTTESLEVKVAGKIKETCVKAGCWMSLEMENDEDMMVFLGDHDFFVPTTGANGLSCFVEGKAYYDTLSVDWLQHLAEDAGRTVEEIAMITEPEFKLAFHADGVIIEGFVPVEEVDHDHDEAGHDHDHDEAGHDHDHDEAGHETESEEATH